MPDKFITLSVWKFLILEIHTFAITGPQHHLTYLFYSFLSKNVSKAPKTYKDYESDKDDANNDDTVNYNKEGYEDDGDAPYGHSTKNYAYAAPKKAGKVSAKAWKF